MPYVVFDIETYPDKTLWTPPPKGPRAKKDPFAPLYAHRVITIGSALLDDELNCTFVGSIGTTHTGDDERALINMWSGWITQTGPALVSFNGKGFDLPVLQLRSLRVGAALPWCTKDYRKRYDGPHIDLLGETTEYGAVDRAGFSLSNMCALIGLPAKGDMDGSKVAGMFEAGRAAEIEAYCRQDVMRTAFLFLRYQFMRGVVSLERYRELASQYEQVCVTNKLDGVLFGIEQKILRLEG